MSNEIKPITIKKCNSKLPLILNKKIIWKKKIIPLDANLRVLQPDIYQEDLIYTSKAGEFFCGDLQQFTIVNRLNKTLNTCRTIARCRSHSGAVFEKTSDDICKLIGQNNYDTLLHTLCSVINQELKIRSIYSLLTIPKATTAVSCQTDEYKNITSNPKVVNTVDIQCQTDESFIPLYKKKLRVRQRRSKSQLAPYVVQETPDPKKPKRVVVTPDNFGSILKTAESVKKEESQKGSGSLVDLGQVFDEDSNGNMSAMSQFTFNSIPQLRLDPMSILDKVIEPSPEIKKKEVEDYKLQDLDSPKDMYTNGKPMPLNQLLHNMPRQHRVTALIQQAINDWNNCMQRDESGHMPIHVAVLNNDLDLLRRQCIVLKMRGISVDIPADNLTPLRMSLYQDNVEMTAMLLQNNADPLDNDEHGQSCFHIAAENPTEHLQALVYYCQHNARKILEEDADIWKPEYANKSDEDLARILMSHISKLYDVAGYTPLMLASKAGRYENIKLLVESCPESVNSRMPNSGNTPLFLAISSACMDATERGNKSKVVDHFRKSVEILVDNGADPNLNNFNGNNVNDLLQDYNIGDLSMLVANKLTNRNISAGQIPISSQKFEPFVLIKDKDGKVDVEKVQKPQKKTVKATRVTKKYPLAQKGISQIKKSSVQKVVSQTKRSPKSPLIIKSETITGQSLNSPVLMGNVGKPDLVKTMTVQSFKLDKPLILKSVLTQNKRKLEMTVEPNSKKSNNTG